MIIKLENIKNARDLGGMKSHDGKHIKPKKLIRSSALFGASNNDINILINNYKLKHVVDFRTEKERCEKPHEIDRFKNVGYSFLQSFEKIQTAVTRDEKSKYLLLKSADNLTVEQSVSIIEDFYNQLPTIESLQKAYQQFFEILLNNKEGSVLWHCSLGKDRAGIAAVLIEYVLGVSENDIMKDYLLTNNYLDDDIDKPKNNAFRVFYGVQASFLECWYNSVNKNFGNLDNYLFDVLNLNEDKISQLRKMYLE